MANDQSPSVFVTGMPRSGTTLLMMMFDSHTYGTMPRGRIVQLTFDRWKHGLLNAKELQEFLHFLYSSDYHNRPPIHDREVLHKLIASKLPLTYQQLISLINFSDASLPDNVCNFWGEKTSQLIWLWDELKAYIACPKLIVLVRDGRAIASSLLKANATGGLETNLFEWSRKYRDFCTKTLELQAQANIYVIRYEDLLREPEQNLRKLSSFCGIDYDSKMLSYSLQSARFQGDPKSEMHRRLDHDPDTSRSNAWKTELPGSLATLVESLISPSLVLWGYPLHTNTRQRQSITCLFNLILYLIQRRCFLFLKYQIKVHPEHRLIRYFSKKIGYS